MDVRNSLESKLWTVKLNREKCVRTQDAEHERTYLKNNVASSTNKSIQRAELFVSESLQLILSEYRLSGTEFVQSHCNYETITRKTFKAAHLNLGRTSLIMELFAYK